MEEKSVNLSLFIFKNLFKSTQFQPLLLYVFSLFGTLKSCVYVFLADIAHTVWCVPLDSPNRTFEHLPSIHEHQFRVRAGSVWTAKHSCESNESTWTDREKKIKQQHKEDREWEGEKIVVGNMTKLLLSPYGCSTSDVRGLFFFFKCSKHCTCLKSSVQKHGSNALFDCLAGRVNYMHYASLL